MRGKYFNISTSKLKPARTMIFVDYTLNTARIQIKYSKNGVN